MMHTMEPIMAVNSLKQLLEGPVADAPTIVHLGTGGLEGDPYDRYLEQRLPGARYLSLDDHLAAAPEPVRGRHPLPEPVDFARALGVAGIGAQDRVVAYDERGGAWAARLVWMLRALEQPAALLDGGIEDFAEVLDRGPVEPPAPAECPVRPWPASALADADQVAAHLDTGGLVIDSRAPARFRGEHEPIDAVAGHIPGAINLPFADNLAEGRFRSPKVLAARFDAVPTRQDDAGGAGGSARGERDDVVVYCGSGVTACHNILAMEHAGLGRPRLYVGSWSGWSSDPARPVGTG